jgi:hypothetical protein
VPVDRCGHLPHQEVLVSAICYLLSAACCSQCSLLSDDQYLLTAASICNESSTILPSICYLKIMIESCDTFKSSFAGDKSQLNFPSHISNTYGQLHAHQYVYTCKVTCASIHIYSYTRTDTYVQLHAQTSRNAQAPELVARLVSEFIAKLPLLKEGGRDDAQLQSAPPLIPVKNSRRGLHSVDIR